MTPRVRDPAARRGHAARARRGRAHGRGPDLAGAADALPAPGRSCRGAWRPAARTRSSRTRPAPRWITGVVWDPDRRLAVGRAGYHGPPDDDGMVEVGYSIDPQYRRQGYARAALRALLDRAAAEPAVTTVRASVSPGNVASRDLVLSEGFVDVGEQIDEEDGLEIVYEVAVALARPDQRRRRPGQLPVAAQHPVADRGHRWAARLPATDVGGWTTVRGPTVAARTTWSRARPRSRHRDADAGRRAGAAGRRTAAPRSSPSAPSRRATGTPSC